MGPLDRPGAKGRFRTWPPKPLTPIGSAETVKLEADLRSCSGLAGS